ncbi:dihydrofolate reductase family protein [Streptomyces sp. NPDC000229]|uniref:dihydrofolate reductase family protein n=1 Tax=Streptomyces sp. NPDC000229 TaxID=3154247 RepID=UPI00331C2AC8
MRKLTYLVACSIDGFIGDPNGDASSMFQFAGGEYLAWYEAEYPDALPVEARTAIGIADAENKRFDTVIQGRGSYQIGLDADIPSPYGHLREIVASRTLEKAPHPNVEIVTGDIVGRVRELKAEDGDLGIWLCGGSQIAGELLDEVDELVIKTYPQVYGAGMPMFGTGFAVTDFALDGVKAFENGVVVRWYSRKR